MEIRLDDHDDEHDALSITRLPVMGENNSLDKKPFRNASEILVDDLIEWESSNPSYKSPDMMLKHAQYT